VKQSPVTSVTAQVLYESNEGNVESLGRFVVNSLKQSCRHVRHGVVAVVVRDHSGRILGIDVHGTPSEEMQEKIEDLLLGQEG